MRRTNISFLLAGGDRRSIGRANEVTKIVGKDTRLFPQLIAAMRSEKPVVRMRAADAIEEISRKSSSVLRPYKELLGLLADAQEQELRWHLALIVPRLSLNTAERQRVACALQECLDDRSTIVKTFALQGLADLSTDDRRLKPNVVDLLRVAARTGTPAMKARSRKLLCAWSALNRNPNAQS